MAIGDDALAAGYELVNPNTDLVRDGAQELNITRDYTGRVKNETRPINRGGTGANNAAQALRNLGIYVQSTNPGHANGRVWIKIPG